MQTINDRHIQKIVKKDLRPWPVIEHETDEIIVFLEQ